MKNSVKLMVLMVLYLGFTIGAHAQWTNTITNGLIVHLTFDSTMDDSSGRTNNATYISTNGLVNQPAGPTYLPGLIGGAVQLTTAADGSTIEFASLGYPNDLRFYDTNNWSVSIWINYLNGTGDAAIIGNKHWWALSNPGWVLTGQPGGNFRVSMADSVNGTHVGAQRPAIIRDGNWHQLAMTFTVGGTVDVYYDGVLDSSYANTITNGTDTYGFVNGVGQPLAMNIGQDGTGAYNGSNPNAPPAYTTGASSMIDAQIDDVGFWNRALTSNEVAAIYSGGLTNIDLQGNQGVAPPVYLTITQQPTSVYGFVGGTATFSVNTTSSVPVQLTYQWNSNGTPITDATNSSYTTPVFLQGDVGPISQFQVQVSGGTNTVESAKASLVVYSTPTAITNELVVHLTFDSTMNDSSGRTNNATYISTNGLVNQPAGPTYMPGRMGEAFQFTTAADGSTIEFASLGYPNDLIFDDTNNWSVSLWINYTNGTGDPGIIGNKHWWAASNPGWVIAGQAGGNFRLVMADSVNAATIGGQFAGAIRDGNWHQLALAFTAAGTLDVYYDGVLDVSLPNTNIIYGTDTYDFLNGVGEPLAMNIGQDGTGAYNGSNPNAPPAYTTGNSSMIDARIDDVGFWRRTLSPREIAGVYNAGQAGTDLSYAVATPGRPSITISGGNIHVSWVGAGDVRLQKTTDLANPLSWANIVGTLGASLYSEPVTGTPTYYRLASP